MRRCGVRLLRGAQEKDEGVIHAVVFDLYETLITESGIQTTRAGSLAATLGLERDAYRREWKARRPDVVRGRMSFAAALMEISATLNGNVDEEVVRRVCEQRIREKAVAYAQVHEEVAALVTTLSRRGVRLAVVSNGFKEDVIGWADWALADKFACTVFSYAERVAKPDPEIYRRAIQQLDVEPAAAAYIGDGADEELAGAAQAGLRAGRAAWFVPHSSRQGTWPELPDCQDALRFVGVWPSRRFAVPTIR
jgi:putative hydrolase of the HAD superfamily